MGRRTASASGLAVSLFLLLRCCSISRMVCFCLGVVLLKGLPLLGCRLTEASGSPKPPLCRHLPPTLLPTLLPRWSFCPSGRPVSQPSELSSF
ncbi:hypothetical protein B0T26DRAFT_730407 [Lasiosphaeria miniovina]|uniref:Uncharacterized protein n=1 Tax=Lasiosphaeria miniovina TaxID=1954250 RepID=A0AA40DJ48_9PEZI|nr:uncharacterized protein B0T26DRAFT_730407 [Lasiosphaeria miniovina]KAK0703236.1 hypothetical protein B0T26DRAFT_730407 [Lasiosphaeria miniovina]